MMTQLPPQHGYQRVAGRIKYDHCCPTPHWLARFISRVRPGDIWACACGQRWRWGWHPLAFELGFRQNEWVRL